MFCKIQVQKELKLKLSKHKVVKLELDRNRTRHVQAVAELKSNRSMVALVLDRLFLILLAASLRARLVILNVLSL